jgi:hypothetical protein
LSAFPLKLQPPREGIAMSSKTPRISRKLRKLVTNPERFFGDMLKKRAVESPGLLPNVNLSFDTTDFMVANGVAVITDPEVVDVLRKLKGSKQLVQVRLSWTKA